MNPHTLETQRSAYQYYEAALPQFMEICNPLFNLGIKHFGYMRIFKDGSYLHFINNPIFKQAYLQTIKDQGQFFGAIHEMKENEVHYGLLNVPIENFDKKKNQNLYLLHDFNIWNVFSIHKMRKDFIECYCYCLTPEDTNAATFYLNHRNLFEHFSDYFQAKAKNIIEITDPKKLAIFEDYHSINRPSQDILLAAKIEHFLTETQRERFNNFRLSKREQDCIQYLVQHKSAKEIGKLMKISPRTVESHLKKIKGKVGVHKNSELISHFLKPSQWPQ